MISWEGLDIIAPILCLNMVNKFSWDWSIVASRLLSLWFKINEPNYLEQESFILIVFFFLEIYLMWIVYIIY